ncbi:MAG: hypothetical protein EP330_19235 [Deltaproteobacteria bacterium]|nr:MAG: hypothetical protein EP330_19235 [Deltaproteobacteria bacterium]
MRITTALGVAAFLAISLACQGGVTDVPVASKVGLAPPKTIERLEDGSLPGTPEAVCSRLVACECNPSPGYAACVAEQKLALKVLDGVTNLQGEIIDFGLGGDQSKEAELMRKMTAMGTELVVDGASTAMVSMANMECPDLCAAIEEMKAEQ